MKKILEYTIYTGIFALLLTPFIIDKTLFFPFITGKAFFFRTIVEIIGLAWMLLALKHEEYRPRASWIAYGVISFLVVMGIANFFGENPFKSFWSNYERMEGYVTLLYLAVYFFVASTMMKTTTLWMRFFNTSIGASFSMSVYAIIQLTGNATINQGGTRVDGTFGNASYLAMYLVFNMFIAAFLFVRSEVKELRWWYGGTILLNGIILYHTATRGAFLGLLAGLLLMLVIMLFNHKQKKWLRNTIISIMVGIVVLTFALGKAQNTDFVRNSDTLNRIAPFLSVEGVKQQALSRVQIWGMAIEGFKERPLLGWGQENFNFIFNKYYSPEMYAQEQWFDRAHNVFFDWLTAGGIIGIIAYLSLFVSPLLYLWVPHTKRFLGSVRTRFMRYVDDKERDGLGYTERAIVIGMFLAYFVHNFFVFDNIVSYFYFFSFLAFIHAIYRPEKPLAGVCFRLSPSIRQYVALPLVLVLFMASFFFFIAEPIQANKTLIEGLKTSSEGVQVDLADFEQAATFNTTGSQEIREQFIQFAVRVIGANVPADFKNTVARSAEGAMLDYIERVPNDARLYVFLSTLYGAERDYKKERAVLLKALELSPRKQQILFGLGGNYVNSGNSAEGFATLKAAYDLAPTYREAVINYAATALYEGRTDIAYPLLIDAFGTRFADDDRIIQAYEARGDFAAIVEIYEGRRDRNPNNPQLRIQLAAAYIQVGRRSDAIAEIREAIRIEPGFRQQGEFYISEIEAGRNP